MNHNPLVSILIPTRNRRNFLEKTLMLALQELPANAELIISDNCSHDGTREFLAEHPARDKFHVILQESNVGMVGNWNSLLERARGEMVKILCDDDLLIPGALRREIEILSKDESLGLVGSKIMELHNAEIDFILQKNEWQQYQQDNDEYQKFDSLEAQRAMFYHENFLGSPSAVLFRKKYWSKFPAQYTYASDWNAWIEIARKAKLARTKSYGCIFRLHEENLTKANLATGNDLVEVPCLRKKILCILQNHFGLAIKETLIYPWMILYRLKRRSIRLFLRGEFFRSLEIWLQVWRALRAHR